MDALNGCARNLPDGCAGNHLPDGWWRKRKILRKEVVAHGTIRALARAHHVPRSTLGDWAKRLAVVVDAPTKPANHVGEAVSETEVLTRRVKELERRLARTRDMEVVQEQVLARLEIAIAAAAPRYRPQSPSLKLSGAMDAQELVLLFSDVHASEVVSEQETLGLNVYNWSVMLDRMAAIQEAVVSHKEHAGFPISALNVWLLGDMLSGDIHEELAETNDRPLAEATVDFACECARWLEEFVPHFEVVRVRGVPGNHPRLSHKPRAKLGHNNADWLAYKMVELYHRANSAIEFEFQRGLFQLVTVASRWTALLMHGDGIRSGFPGVPWGGVSRRVKQLQSQFYAARKPFDFVAMGHWHDPQALGGIPGVQTLINGSVKGPDEYALKMLGQGMPPSQRLLAVHPRRGITALYWIELGSQTPAAEGWAIAA